MGDVCCNDFMKAVRDEVIDARGSDIGMLYFIKSVDLVYDGDDRYDDMGAEYQIDYCPFCGKGIKRVKE